MAYLSAVVGLSGSGKTTAINGTAEILRANGLSVATYHDRLDEPSSIKIDQIIQTENLSSYARMLMFLAARRQSIDKLIKPDLSNHDVIMVDHYYPCTIAYQGYGEGLNINMVSSLATRTVSDIHPDKFFLLDIDASESLSRLALRDEIPQVFDNNDINFHNRARRGYLEQAENSDNFVILNASLRKETIASKISNVIMRKYYESL